VPINALKTFQTWFWSTHFGGKDYNWWWDQQSSCFCL